MHRFQSTLPREERHRRPPLFNIQRYFNPRSHERSDSEVGAPCEKQAISIHAPTRGATPFSCGCVPGKDFNPRSHERSDSVQLRMRTGKRFQSTLPREERRWPARQPCIHRRFQSTLPREERQQYCTKNLFIFIQYRQ